MAVFASATDDKTFEQFYPSCDYFIRIIVNKKREMKLDFVDTLNGLKYENLPWIEMVSQEQLELENLVNEFNEKIKAEQDEMNKVAKTEITKVNK